MSKTPTGSTGRGGLLGRVEERASRVVNASPAGFQGLSQSLQAAVSSAANVRPSSVSGLAKSVEGALASAAQARPLVPATADPSTPAIPLSILDAPSQRAYAVAAYVLLWAWKLYDYSKLIRDDADSLFFFMKWTMIDGLYMYGLPALRIPWLEWSGPTSLALFMTHALLDWVMMFRIPIPIESWLIAVTKVLYDRELAVSERKVNPADIIRNSAVILGKHTIHVLPEGSAAINPDRHSYCLGPSKTSVTIPIRINQTAPVLIELTRFDLADNSNQTLTISAKQAKALKKQAERHLSKHDVSSPRYLQYEVKETGLYRLEKVVDESGLEVRRRPSEALVVTCPSALIKPVPRDKCKSDLSDIVLQLHGTPPFKLKYSRTVNDEDKTFSFQSIQPENLVSPLTAQKTAGPLVLHNHVDLSWARPHLIDVPLNESLNTLGQWVYSVDEVHDACGNSVKFSRHSDGTDRPRHSAHGTEQIVTVHPRPTASLHRDESPCVLKVARGKGVNLPVFLENMESEPQEQYTMTVKYTPLQDLEPNGEHAPDAKAQVLKFKGGSQISELVNPGLYSLISVSSRHCTGEVLEPTTCMLLNPSEPSLTVSTQNIYDSCAGNPIGLLVDLDLTGTPPFVVKYTIKNKKDKHLETQLVQIYGVRHQLELKPLRAGHYIYQFQTIRDSVYDERPISSTKPLEQDVKPPASAHFTSPQHWADACLDADLPLEVAFEGEGPWSLEYEIIHDGTRQKHEIDDLQKNLYNISTGALREGGEFTVALVSVQDRSNCKVFLTQEFRIEVRPQRPKVGFGLLEGKRTVTTLEGRNVSLPLRLTGQPPWDVRYRRINDKSGKTVPAKLTYSNSYIDVGSSGKYELVDVNDAECPGMVEEAANTFTVDWVARPGISISDSAVGDMMGSKFVKPAICEGEEDAVEIVFSGTPPYHVKYQQRVKPVQGSAHLSNKEFTAGLRVASIDMETQTPGTVDYEFQELADRHYNQKKDKKQQLLHIQQTVHAKPSAAFSVPGKTYKFCKEEEEGEEVIPLTLSGTPPFYVEIGIKHHSQPQPEIIRVSDIQRPHYDIHVPHRLLSLGRHIVSVRAVRDAHGCQRRYEFNAPHVLVNVADAPSILPLESRADYCVGEWISYTLSGSPPFSIYYTFQGVERKATAATTSFRRIADSPGQFTITAIADQSSNCRFKTRITKSIHPMPSVKISKGKDTYVDIHEGGTAEILFEFSGTPPFEFTYTRSDAPPKSSSQKHHHAPRILETKSETSIEHVLSIRASEEGTYEAVAIKDYYCAFSKLGKAKHSSSSSSSSAPAAIAAGGTGGSRGGRIAAAGGAGDDVGEGENVDGGDKEMGRMRRFLGF